MSGRNGNLLAEVERDALGGSARAAHRGFVVGLSQGSAGVVIASLQWGRLFV
jgi:hypothetical protein